MHALMSSELQTTCDEAGNDSSAMWCGTGLGVWIGICAMERNEPIEITAESACTGREILLESLRSSQAPLQSHRREVFPFS